MIKENIRESVLNDLYIFAKQYISEFEKDELIISNLAEDYSKKACGGFMDDEEYMGLLFEEGQLETWENDWIKEIFDDFTDMISKYNHNDGVDFH